MYLSFHFTEPSAEILPFSRPDVHTLQTQHRNVENNSGGKPARRRLPTAQFIPALLAGCHTQRTGNGRCHGNDNLQHDVPGQRPLLSFHTHCCLVFELLFFVHAPHQSGSPELPLPLPLPLSLSGSSTTPPSPDVTCFTTSPLRS